MEILTTYNHQITLIGALGRDPEMRYLPDGVAILNFSVATSHKWTNPQGVKNEQTIWWKVSCTGKFAETMNEWLRKGTSVVVVGRLRVDQKTGMPGTYNKRDGTVGVNLEIVAEGIRMTGGRPKDDGETTRPTQTADNPNAANTTEEESGSDDRPF